MNSTPEARYLIRLTNQSYTPAEGLLLLENIRSHLRPFDVKVINLRVSRKAVECDLFLDPEKAVAPVLDAFIRFGDVLTSKRLDLPPPKALSPDAVFAEARALFQEERYWEVHEVLEGLWKITSGPEKAWIQGVILTAAALVHVQKNEETVTWPMLTDALHRLSGAPSHLHGFPIQALIQDLQRNLQTRSIHFSFL